MKKSNKTKRALISSLLSLVICVSMLVGSTYAWFTDTAAAGVNNIQSGTLDVDLVNEAGDSLVGEQLSFKNVEGSADILWEPGCTYELEPVFVKNNGNLALKYKIVVNGIDGDAKLLEAIDWTVEINDVATDLDTFESHLDAQNALSDAIVLRGHMKEEAGNEYQNLQVTGLGITVYATQYTYEKDMTDENYDANAVYDGQTLASTSEDFSAALTDATVEEIILGDDLTVSGPQVSSGKTINGNGNTITVSNTGSDCGLAAKSGTIENVTVTGSGRGIGTGSSGAYGMDGDLTLNNVTVDGPVYAINIGKGNGHKLTANDSTFLGWNSMAGVEGTFNNCTFGKGTTGSAANYAVFAIYNTITFNNCAFNDGFDVYGRASSTGVLTLNNCTHDGTAVTAANFATLFDDPHDSDFDYLMNNMEIYVDGVRVNP